MPTRAGSSVSRAYATSPLRFLTPRNAGRAAWIYTASYGGGLLGGDALQMSIDVAPGATAFISTQSSTKIYRSDRGSRATVDARVGAAARLIVWPDPVVCFAGSTYRQQQGFDVERTGALVVVDWMTSGRRGSGERWRFHRYETRTAVRYDGQLVLWDAMILSDDEGVMTARMGRFDVLCSVAIVGTPLRQQAESIVTNVTAAALQRRGDVLIAAAALGKNDASDGNASSAGCILRIAGPSVEAVAAILRRHLCFVPCLLGDDPGARKW